MNAVVERASKRLKEKESKIALHLERANRIYEGANKVQQQLMRDTAKRRSTRCPRRAGKSFGFTSVALEFGERNPGSRLLIISLTLKSTKENYWAGAPGGIFTQNALYDLGLTFNQSDIVWYHENGSRGRLAGAETRADIEYLRGAAAEADVVIIDECKSFSPSLLAELIRDIIEPGLLTRDGILIMGGTPGSVPSGPFYHATQLGLFYDEARTSPTCLPWNKHPGGDSKIWSLHTWSMKENTAKKHQWALALQNKKDNGWTDDNPRWRREYLGEWVTDASELVYYGYTRMKAQGKSMWNPVQTVDNPTGLPQDLGPWRLIVGLDFGYEDDNALVVAAYSDTVKELRQVYNFKSPHLTIDQFETEIWHAIHMFGYPEVIVADAGALGKTIVETLNGRGLSIIAAEKREKYDYIELVNSDFLSSKIRIIENSDLDDEMSILQWDLEKARGKGIGGSENDDQSVNPEKKYLVRTGKLREDPSCANHLCDAFLYLWRYSNHYWAEPVNAHLEVGTPEYYQARENARLAEIRKERRLETNTLSRLRDQDRKKWSRML